MTEEQHDELIEAYIDNIKKYMNETGSLFAHISFFAENEENESSIIHTPIPGEFLKSEESKDEFVDQIIPGIFEKLKEKFKPIGMAWASEAWMRVVDNDQLENYDSLYDIPIKKEVVCISIDTDYKSYTSIYEIIRKGKQINSEGELTDEINLELINENANDAQSGRFVNLYKKLKGEKDEQIKKDDSECDL